MKYYLDTCVWRDFYENRKSKTGRNLGKEAFRLIKNLLKKKATVLFSDLVVKELRIEYSMKDVEGLFSVLMLSKRLQWVGIEGWMNDEAKVIAAEKNVPLPDALHCIIARENEAIVVSQDKHMQALKSVALVLTPKEVI